MRQPLDYTCDSARKDINKVMNNGGIKLPLAANGLGRALNHITDNKSHQRKNVACRPCFRFFKKSERQALGKNVTFVT